MDGQTTLNDMRKRTLFRLGAGTVAAGAATLAYASLVERNMFTLRRYDVPVLPGFHGEEATDAVPLGGAGMKSKWGTPDVVGVYRALAAQLIKFSPELVAAEIKLDPGQPVVAFGQAIAYRLFAARTYVVMPNTISEEDESRLEALSMLFGVGFVLFDPSDKNVKFSIRVRAQRFSPDHYYVNEFATRLHVLDPSKFQQIFG
jgi:preprotein translocase subunit Sec61beta